MNTFIRWMASATARLGRRPGGANSQRLQQPTVRLYTRLLLISMVVMALLGGLAHMDGVRLQADRVASARANDRADADKQAQHIDEALDRMAVLTTAVGELWLTNPSLKQVPLSLLRSEPDLINACIVTAEGLMERCAVAGNAPLSAVEAPFFQHHLQHPDLRLRVGRPTVGPLSGETGIVLTRRISHADGRFGGVALAFVRPALFERVFSTHAKPHALTALVGDDGEVRAGVYQGQSMAVGVALEGFRPQGAGVRQATAEVRPKGQPAAMPAAVARTRTAGIQVLTAADPETEQAAIAQALADNQVAWLQAAGTSLLLLAGLGFGLQQRQRTTLQAEDRARRMRTARDQAAGDGSWDWWPQQQRMVVSERWKAMLGYASHEVGTAQNAIAELVHPDDLVHINEALARIHCGQIDSFNLEHRLLHRSGQWRWVEGRGAVVERDISGHATYIIGTDIDIHERRVHEEQVRHLALHDPLTDLPHRRALLGALPRLLERTDEGGRFALALLDLDHFKDINDALGHALGDQLLVAVAHRLGRVPVPAGASLSVYRMGGDEFCLVFRDLPQPLENSALETLEAALRWLGEEFRIGPHLLRLSGSAGLAIGPDHGNDAPSLLRAADLAMYAAKQAGRATCHLYDPRMLGTVLSRNALARELAAAVPAGQLLLHFQPIVSLRDGRCTRVEALVRWQHPVHGLLSPGRFIPVAEATGVIEALGNWVFTSAVRQVAAWQAAGLGTLQVSLNKSALQFRDGGQHIDGWLEQLQMAGVPGNALRIEITESTMVEGRHNVREQLLRLQAAGMSLALDDFGVGYSALSVLERYNLDCVKIDMSFVRNIEQRARARALCRAVIEMAHSLGATVVAEGVETPQQAQLLRDMGCDYAQGHLFAHPMGDTELRHWWTSGGHGPQASADLAGIEPSAAAAAATLSRPLLLAPRPAEGNGPDDASPAVPVAGALSAEPSPDRDAAGTADVDGSATTVWIMNASSNEDSHAR